jgi:addiction module HigA family antidote
MVKHGMRPVHPGEILREEYLLPLGMSVQALAQALRVPATCLHEIVKERRSVTPDTALRLARYFGTDAQSWLNLQMGYDLKIAEAELKDRIEKEVESMVLARATSETQGDPVLGQFQDFLALDMAAHPQHLNSIDAGLRKRIKSLVKNAKVDLDAPLAPEDE